MRIFITGATGYIGQRIAFDFAEQGYTVHALIRSKNKESLLRHKNIVLFYGDVNQPDALAAAAQQCQVCIHAAGFSAITAKNPKQYSKINITGTQEVFTAARKAGIQRFVYISSAGVLGPSFNGLVNEDTVRTVPFFNDYEHTKSAAENWVLAQNSPQLPVVSLNLSRVYGPGILSESNAATRLIEKVSKGWRFIPGNGTAIGNYVYINDVITACHLAIENGKGGQRYIIGGQNLSYNEFFSVIKEATGARQKMIYLPFGIIKLIAQCMKLLAPLGITPTITPEWVRRYMYDWVLDNSKATYELGVQFTPFKKGVQKTVEWLKKNDPEIQNTPIISEFGL